VKFYIESRPPSPAALSNTAEQVETANGQEQDLSKYESECTDDDGPPVTSASLCFVDLAGSERCDFGTKDEQGDSKLRQTEVSVGLQCHLQCLAAPRNK
jgi:hypothetical protein